MVRHQSWTSEVVVVKQWSGLLVLLAALALVVVGGCSSSGSSGASSKDTATTTEQSASGTSGTQSGDSVACANALKKYHDDLVATDDNLTADEENADQLGTLNNCTRSQWMSEVEQYDGSLVGDQPGNIVEGGMGSPDIRSKVLAAFCSGNESAQACQ
jgi:hypothetical protein